MRVCFLEGDMSRSGGTERMCAWLANALAKKHEIYILSLRMKGDKTFFTLDDGVNHQVVPGASGKLGILKQIAWIHRFVKENHIDELIHVDMGIGFYGILAAKGTRAKTVTWEHGNFYNNWGSSLFPYMRRYAAKKSDAVVVLTERDRRNYQENISGCAPLYIIPNPAESHPYVYNNHSKIILSVGHLLENKGYHRVVEMAKTLLKDTDWTWVICGEGPERTRLEQMIQEAGLEGNVKLPGLIKDMDQIYRSASMLVMTSDMEGLPMVLLEGKGYGLPLIAFDIMTGPSDIIADGVNGFLVKPFDLEEMEDKIKLLQEDDVLRKKMSENASIGMDKFSEKVILDQWEMLLQKEV